MSSFLTRPNIPDKKVTKVLVDYRIGAEAEKTLNKQGIEVIKTVKHKNLYEAVCGHPDMQLHHLGGDEFVCEPSVFDYYKKILPKATLINGDTKISCEYPFDIAYNGAACGNYFFHNLKFTESNIYEYYKANGVKLINVKQGYTKCSVCILSESALITSDRMIAKKAVEEGLDALFFDSSEIMLPGLSNGFIGGICGLIDKNVLAVNGDILLTKNGEEFSLFCERHGIEILPLHSQMPVDIGSIIPLEQI